MTTTRTHLAAAATIAALLGVGAACDSREPPAADSSKSTDATDVRPEAPPAPAATPSPIDSSVQSALPWIPAHQGADGRWGDSATTGIVLLTFLGAGETHQMGSKRIVVKNGLNALRAGQDAEGCLAEPTSPRRLRDHAIAGLALTESYGMSGSLALKPSAQRAVDFALKTRTPGGAWHFTATHLDQIDVETTVWMSMLLKSAHLSELDVDAGALREVAAALDGITEPTTGRVIVPSNSPATISSDAETAAALVVRVFSGRRDDTDALTAKSADVLVAHPPTADSTDLQYVYLSGIAMIGLAGDRFRAWLPGLNSFVGAQQQRQDGPERGSWDPPAGRPESERIWSTAYHMLCAEFYYGRVGHASMRR